MIPSDCGGECESGFGSHDDWPKDRFDAGRGRTAEGQGLEDAQAHHEAGDLEANTNHQ